MKRLGVLGAGRHSSDNHGPALKLLAQREPARVELAAVCDLDEERARAYREKFGFARAYTDSAVMLEREKLDGLLVISPVALTESLVSALLPRRIPLLIEKPPGKNSESTRRLLALARQHQTAHMVSFNRRHGPAFRRALAWIGEIPDARRPLFVLARMLRHQRREPKFAVETGIHLVDAVLAILGFPARVSTRRIADVAGPHSTGRITPEESCFFYSSRIAFSSGPFDQASASADLSAEFSAKAEVTADKPAGGEVQGRAEGTRTGASLADLVIAPDAGANEETYEIYGREYCIRIDHLNCALRIRERNAEALSWQPPADAESVERDGTLGEMETFLAFLEDPTLRVPTLADGLAAMLTAEAVANAIDTDLTRTVL